VDDWVRVVARAAVLEKPSAPDDFPYGHVGRVLYVTNTLYTVTGTRWPFFHEELELVRPEDPT
jgi:hypothetical protein